MLRFLFLFVAGCLVLTACSRVFSSGDPYQDFKKTVLQANTDRNAALAGRVFHPYDITGQIEADLTKLRAALDQRIYYDAVIILKEIVSQFSENASVQEAGGRLLDEIHAQEKVDLVDLAKQFQTTQKLEADAFMTAEKPEDLNATLQGLAALEKQVGRCWTYDGGRVESYREFLQTKRYVAKWQDYLLARNIVDSRKAFRDLLYLKDINQIGLPLPRSQVIERLAVLEQEKPMPKSFPLLGPSTNKAVSTPPPNAAEK